MSLQTIIFYVWKVVDFQTNSVYKYSFNLSSLCQQKLHTSLDCQWQCQPFYIKQKCYTKYYIMAQKFIPLFKMSSMRRAASMFFPMFSVSLSHVCTADSSDEGSILEGTPFWLFSQSSKYWE
jgi:hypothetical protein